MPKIAAAPLTSDVTDGAHVNFRGGSRGGRGRGRGRGRGGKAGKVDPLRLKG
jgi:hypothetical protein